MCFVCRIALAEKQRYVSLAATVHCTCTGTCIVLLKGRVCKKYIHVRVYMCVNYSHDKTIITHKYCLSSIQAWKIAAICIVNNHVPPPPPPRSLQYQAGSPGVKQSGMMKVWNMFSVKMSGSSESILTPCTYICLSYFSTHHCGCGIGYAVRYSVYLSVLCDTFCVMHVP